MNNYDYSDTFYALTNASSLISNLVSLALAVLLIVAWWKIFEKAGEHGWAAIIPYYNSYVLFKISGKKKLFWGYLAVSLLMVALYIVFFVILFSTIFTGLSHYGYGADYWETVLIRHGVGMIICLLLILACVIALFVFKILQCIGLTKNFDVSGGYAVGLIFLPYIFYCIFAFSSNFVYRGGSPKYGYGPYGIPYGYPPQNGGQAPVFMNPYSSQPQGYPQQNPQAPVYMNPYSGQPQQPNYVAQPGYGQPQQPNYVAQPGYGQPQQQNYSAQVDNAQPQQPASTEQPIETDQSHNE